MAFFFLLNRLLDAEPWARERLAPFAGETLELRAPPLPALRLAFSRGERVEAGGRRAEPHHDAEARAAGRARARRGARAARGGGAGQRQARRRSAGARAPSALGRGRGPVASVRRRRRAPARRRGARLRRLARRRGAAPRRGAGRLRHRGEAAARAPRRARRARRAASRDCATPSRGWKSGSSALGRLLRLARILAVGLRFGLHDLSRRTRAAPRAAQRAARGARDARADLRQVRPGAVHAPRPGAARHRRRAGASCRTGCRRFRPSWRWRRSSARSASRIDELFSSFETRARSPAPRSPRCTSPRCTTAREVAVKVLRPGVERAIARDLALLETGRRRWSSAVGGRPAPQAARGGRRVRAPPRRRARSACARRPTPASCGAISPARRCCWCRRCTGTFARSA